MRSNVFSELKQCSMLTASFLAATNTVIGRGSINENWYNAHNFYGELAEIEAATVEDATSFFGKFYRPNNAVLIIAGDIDYDQTRAMVERYFGPIPRGEAAEQNPERVRGSSS